MAAEEDARSSCCKTQEVLETAQVDLNNAAWPGMLGQIAGPVNSVLVSPALHVVTAIVPPVASLVPLLDNVSSAMLGTAFHVVKSGYTVLPHVPSLREQAHDEITLATANARQAATQDANDEEEKKDPNIIVVIPNAVMSLGAALFGYGINSTLDLITSFEEKHAEWQKVSNEFVGYLKQYGIDKELKSLIMNPRTNINMLVMSRIQHDLNNSTADGRQKTALDVSPFTNDKEGAHSLAIRASRFIKYSIAAYGVYMVESSWEARKLVQALWGDENFRPDESNGSTFLHEAGSLNMKKVMNAKVGRIAKFLNIDKSDVKFATEPGGDLKLVGHFVAVDHETKSVVLAIRGTHNTSEWVADFDATAVPFCGGVAHKGMAERAINLWENRDTRNAVARALYYNEGYDFVVCGQSLGAGVANLVNIKCHHSGENLFQGKKSTCFAYGGPPVFAYTPGSKDSKGIKEAFASSYNYIHGKDMVAHASIDAVRRVMSTLEALDDLTSRMSPLDRYLLARGVKQPSDIIVQVVSDGSKNLVSKPGADRLKLPGKFVAWFKQVSDDPITFDTCYCDPTAVSDLGIFLDIRMCTDHLPVGYELALESIAKADN